MKISDYIFLARVNLSRRKKSVIINSILIVVSMLILILSLSFTKNLEELIDKAILNNISYRTVVISGGMDKTADKIIEDVKGLDHVVEVMDQMDYTTGASNFIIDGKEEEGYISFLGASSDIHPNVILGRNIGENETNVCIIPKNFYPYGSNKHYDKDRIINGEELIGKKLNIKYNSFYYNGSETVVKDEFTKEFEIIGVYDNKENVSNMNECYISFDDVYEICDTSEKNSVKADNVVFGESKTAFAIIDNPLNVDSVIEEINDLGYSRVMPRSIANTDLVNIVNVVGILVTSVILIIVISNLVISSIKFINEKGYEIGILKAIGYKNKNIRNIIYYENILIGLISYIIAIIISIISIIFFKNNVVEGDYSLEIININLDIIVCIIALIISIIIPLISASISSRKALKKSIVELNKEG